VTISFVIAVHPYGTAWLRIPMKFDMSIFGKSVEKIQVSLKPDKNNGYFT
jgi:hypothetical protein